MMQDQNVSVSDALVMCRFLAPRNAHDTPCFGRHFSPLHMYQNGALRMSLSVNYAVRFARPFHRCSRSLACSHSLPSYTLLLGFFEDVIPDTFLMEADQV